MPSPHPPSRKVRWRPYPRTPLAFDSSGPPTEAECLGCAERRDCSPGKPAASSLTFSEAFGPAAVALSREHGSYSAFQRDTSQSSFHPIVTQDPLQSLARGNSSHPSLQRGTEAGHFFPSHLSCLSHPPRSPSGPSLSHGNGRCQRNPRIKSFIVF